VNGYGGGWSGLGMNFLLLVLMVLMMDAAAPKLPSVLSDEDEKRLNPRFRWGAYLWCLIVGHVFDYEKKRFLPQASTPDTKRWQSYCQRCQLEVWLTQRTKTKRRRRRLKRRNKP
jgi:hypothetical protein